jgi:hypothetical protein
MALAIPTVVATTADVMKAAEDLFDFRQSSASDTDPQHRHPIMYRGYKWAALPASEKMYYCDMAGIVLQSFGVNPTMPSFVSA